LRERAPKEHYLGGADHPFRYKHWFWDVTAYDAKRGKVPGSDWNKVCAFYPASTAAGVLYESALRLTDPASPYFIADLYFGKTPLRSLIHDSILGEIPISSLDHYIDRLSSSMTLPLRQLPYKNEDGNPAFLSFGVDIKVGRDWGSMVPIKQYKSTKILTFQKGGDHSGQEERQEEVLDVSTGPEVTSLPAPNSQEPS
jgi:hypothetical protein